MARLVGQHGENDETQIARIERAAVARLVAASPVATKARAAAEAVMSATPTLLAAEVLSRLVVIEVSEMHVFFPLF